VVPVNTPLLDGNELAYLTECVTSGWISSEGPFVERFEQDLARRVGRQFGAAACNGTAALELAVAALAIGPGDEVILPAFTIISCAAAVVRAGATPVLVDTDPATWNMRVDQIAARITSRTRAIMVVHTYGLPVDMDPVLALAARHGLAVIEDAAEMHGQTYKDRPCGSFGAISTFSFYPNKHVTTGEGGMVLTDDAHLAARVRDLRNLCFSSHRRFVHECLGWNYRMSNLQAALGVAQLEQLDRTIDRKRRMGDRYNAQLAGTPGLALPPRTMNGAESIYWVYGVVLDDEVPFDAEELGRRLADRHIGTRPFFWPMHEQPVFKRMGLFEGERHPVAERLARRGLYLPSGVALSDAQIDEVSAGVRNTMKAVLA
jgi:perosamine synthetase